MAARPSEEDRRGRVAQLPELPRAAEDRVGARVVARPEDDRAALPRARHLESLLRKWREQFLAAGVERLSGRVERTEADELRRQVARLERALGPKTMQVEAAGNSCGDGGEHARCPLSRTGRARLSRRAGGQGGGDQPASDLSSPPAGADRRASPPGLRRTAWCSTSPPRPRPPGRGWSPGSPQASLARRSTASARSD